MEASLVVLSARLNWRLEEMVYVPVFDSCVDRENSLALHKIFCTADLTDALERRPRLKQTLVDMHHVSLSCIPPPTRLASLARSRELLITSLSLS